MKVWYAVVILLLIGTIPVSIEDVKSEQVEHSVQNIVTTSMQALSPTIPEAEAHVALPDKISIPTINVNAQILTMGLTADGRMDVPHDFKNVGWYKFSARPGEIGSAVIGAHVDNGGSIAGVFKKLKYLSKGDDIYITDSDGVTTHYKVIGDRVYNYKTQFTKDVFGADDAARLNLITCYGTWLPKENTYNERLVVFAALVK